MADPNHMDKIFERFSQQLTQFTHDFTQQFKDTFSTMMQEQTHQTQQIQQTHQDQIHYQKQPMGDAGDYYRKTKIDFPRFESGDPAEWIYKVNKYFEYHLISENNKLSLVALHLDGASSTWYQWMETNHQIRSWADFTMQLQIRFGPSPYDDPNTQLSKLTQTGSVAEYEVRFQAISNKIHGLPESHLKGCYIAGLRSDIQCEVISAQPYSLQHAIGLSKLYEGKFKTSRNSNFLTKTHESTSLLGPRPQVGYSPTTKTALMPYSPLDGSGKIVANNKDLPYHKLPIKLLSAAERQIKMEKGQCFNCEEKWHKGHRCKGQMSLMLLDGMVPEGSSEDIKAYLELGDNQEISKEPSLDEPATGNLYALIGNSISRCLRLHGCVNGKKLQILVDGGSSHNFLQARVAKFLGLDITPTPNFSVIVGNGENLICVGQCKQVSCEIQGHKFKIDFYVIDLHGADAVLGVTWQESFGEIKINYKQSYIKFLHGGKEVTLQGTQDSLGPELICAAQLHKLKKRNEVVECYILTLVDSVDNQPVFKPTAVLSTRKKLVNNHWVPRLFIQWECLTIEEATWVDEAEFKKLYPCLHLEDKVLVEGVGNVVNNEVEMNVEAEQERDELISSKNEVENENENEAAELEDMLTLDKLRKSRRNVKEPAWMKDFIKGKNGKGKTR